MQLLAYIGEFSGDVCISPEFLFENLYIFSVGLFAILFIELMEVESHTTSILEADCLFPTHLIVRSNTFLHCQPYI
jgi:hypothetical protein